MSFTGFSWVLLGFDRFLLTRFEPEQCCPWSRRKSTLSGRFSRRFDVSCQPSKCFSNKAAPCRPNAFHHFTLSLQCNSLQWMKQKNAESTHTHTHTHTHTTLTAPVRTRSWRNERTKRRIRNEWTLMNDQRWRMSLLCRNEPASVWPARSAVPERSRSASSPEWSPGTGSHSFVCLFVFSADQSMDSLKKKLGMNPKSTVSHIAEAQFAEGVQFRFLLVHGLQVLEHNRWHNEYR